MRRAFSLIETMAAMFLVCLILGLALELMSEYSAALRFAAAKDSSLGVAQMTLQHVVDEVRESTLLVSPVDANPSPCCNSKGSTPNVPFSVPAAGWSPWVYWYPWGNPWGPTTPAPLMAVTYQVSNQQLLRQVGPIGGGPATTQAIMADSIGGLGVALLSLNLVEIRLSVSEASRTSLLTQRVWRALK